MTHHINAAAVATIQHYLTIALRMPLAHMVTVAPLFNACSLLCVVSTIPRGTLIVAHVPPAGAHAVALRLVVLDTVWAATTITTRYMIATDGPMLHVRTTTVWPRSGAHAVCAVAITIKSSATASKKKRAFLWLFSCN